MELTREEHQELILMLGSRKEWETYLGLTKAESNSTWTEHALCTPVEYVRLMLPKELLALIADKRSVKTAAEHLGVSESFLVSRLREITNWIGPATPSWTADEIRALFKRYRSVRFLARSMKITEANVRAAVVTAGLEIASLVDYSTGMHSNAKGRRAELEYAALRQKQGVAVVDRNLLDGSQAEYDFDDPAFGRVNVKSSARCRFTAQTRKENPHYWKFSTKGRDKTDWFAVMCYDETMSVLIGYQMILAASTTKKSEVLKKTDLLSV